jgi:hypothetical protein
MTSLRLGLCWKAGWRLAALAIWGMFVSGPAAAQVTPAAGSVPPDDTPAIRLGAVVFYDYTYQLTPKQTDEGGHEYSPTSFNLNRAYINVTGNISHVVAFRITPDVTRESGSGSSLNGSLTFRIKFGYAQFNLDDWMWRGSWVRAGIQGTPYIDYFDVIYRYRFQGTDFIERDAGLSSSDAGVSFHTDLPKNYGDVHVGIFNGEGYQRAETNNQKAIQIRGTVRPLPNANGILRGLRGTVYFHEDHYVHDAERNRFVANVMVEHRRFNAGFDYLKRTDQRLPTAVEVDSDGYSLFVTPFLKEKGNGPEALVRYDSFRGDTTLDARQNRWIVGAAYWFPHPGGNATAALLLDFEQVTFDDYAIPQPKQQRIFVHGLISF